MLAPKVSAAGFASHISISLTRERDSISDMAFMNTRMLLAAALCVMVGILESKAQDISVGEELYQSVCRNCHGPSAQGLASYPKLAGQTADYLTARLERYRAGERIGPNSMLMIPHAKELSDEEITNLVAYVTTSFE